MYITVSDVMSKLQQDLYDETVIEDVITDTDVETSAWVNTAVRRSVYFTEEELAGDDYIIRLASNCFSAFRVMSEQLEGQNIESKSLAVFRYEEAMTYIRMWCAVNGGIIPAFDDIYIPSAVSAGATTEVGASFAYAIGQDSVCI
jgi:hypothetical protein